MRTIYCLRLHHIQKLFLYTFIALIIWCLLYSLLYNEHSVPDNTFESCPIPNLAQFSSIRDFKFVPEELQCSDNVKSVTVHDGFVFIQNGFFCEYQCVDWFNDFYSVVKQQMTLSNATKSPCSYFITKCNHADSPNEIFTDFVISLERDLKSRERSNCKIAFDTLVDILILGVGSLSGNAWQKMLPETYKTFQKILNGVTFPKFNTVSDGPTGNILAILTGSKDSEVHESRKKVSRNNTIDDFNWIWKHLKDKGYVTSFTDERTTFGVFQNGLNGFESQPTDLYLRTVLLAADRLNLIDRLCFLSKPLHKVVIDFQSQFDDVYSDTLKFSFIYLSRFSSNLSLNYIDRDLSKFLADSKERNPNLFIILFSDDGKFMTRNSSMVDKYEERMPFLGISLPNNMESQRTVLEDNSNKLTSAFDVHATLEDLIGIYSPSSSGRHMSLLRSVPDNRICSDIDVAPHWCSCFNWNSISNPTKDRKILDLSLQVVEILSNKTEEIRHLCEPLTLDYVLEAHSIVPTSDVLRFKKSADQYGFIADMTDNTQQDLFWFRITLVTKPVSLIFTVSITAKLNGSKSKNIFSIGNLESEDIVRMNMQTQLVRCLQVALKNDQERLREMENFCICKDLGE